MAVRTVVGMVAVLLAAAAGASAAPGDIPKPPGTNPDDRGWEKVSPDDKNGADVYFQQSSIQAAVDGGGVAFKSSGAAGAPSGATVANGYVARRGGGGWTTGNVTWPVADERAGAITDMRWGPSWYSPDLAQVAFMNGDPPLVGGAPQGIRNLYLRELATDANHLLTPTALSALNPFFVLANYEPVFADATADGGRVLFESEAQLTADAPDQSGSFAPTRNLYLWHDGQTDLIASNAVAGRGLRATSTQSIASSAMSDDGARVVYTVPRPPGVTAQGGGDLYLWENGTASHVNASQRAGALPDDARPAVFQTATPDGEHVFFLSCERLTDDSTADPDDGSECNGSTSTLRYELYRYDVATGSLVDLTADPSVGSMDPGTRGVIAVSADGSRVYFAGSDNKVRLWEQGDITDVTSAVDMSLPSVPSGIADDLAQNVVGATIGVSPSRLSRVSRDGRHLLFAVNDELDPGSPTGGYVQSYLYDADLDELRCVSCPGGGVAATGAASFSPVEGGHPGITRQYTTRAMDDAGTRAFFETATALVPEDVNGKIDVYQYDVATGEQSLVSSGRVTEDARFGDVSPDGRAVFFATAGRLVGSDRDNLRDLYVANVGGGFPEVAEADDLECEGDACQGAASSGPGGGAVSGSGMARGGDGSVVRASLRLAGLSVASRLRAARTGTLVLRVRVNRPGRIRAIARARLGGPRLRSAGRASRLARRAGAVRLTLRLSDRARRRLAAGRPVSLLVSVRFAGRRDGRRLVLDRKGAR